MATSGYGQVLQQHYEQLTGEDRAGGTLRPFFTVADKEDDDVLEYLENKLVIYETEQEERMAEQMANMRFVKALQAIGKEDVRLRRTDGRPMQRSQMFVLNHARDFLHQSVSRLMRFNPALDVTPQNNEYTDRLGARFSKRTIDHLFYINDSRMMVENACLEMKACGESFVFVEWDPYIGDKDPIAEQLEQMEPQEKQFFLDNQNEAVFLDTVKRVGDVAYRQPLPWMVWHEPQVRWKDVNDIFWAEIKHIDEIRAENPNINMDDAQPIALQATREGSSGPGFMLGEYTIQYHYYHRRHRFLDKGAYVRFIPGTLLHRGELPYSHGELPCARLIDFTDPENAHGISFLTDIKPPLVLFNKLWNLKYRNIATVSHPKIMVPEGSCNISSLANGPLVVEYQYPMKPEIITFQALNPEMFTVTAGLMQQTQQLSGTFGMSRGEQIKNARAASILNFYEEQEAQRESSQMAKKNAFIEKLGRLSLGTAGDYYKPDDGRVIRIIGKSNRFKVQKVDDVAKLSGPYDIKVEYTTALAETKQGRIDQISALSNMPLSQNKNDEAKPGLFTREQVLRMIEVADSDEFFEMATAAADCAESENEDLFEGLGAMPPSKEQAHLVHWAVHFQFLQSREFNDVKGLPPEVKEAFIGHLRTHEMFMYDLAMKSLTFAQYLMELPYYPAVFELGANATVAQLILLHQMPPPPEKTGEAPPPGMEGEAPPEEGAPLEEAPAEEAKEEPAKEPPLESAKKIVIQRDAEGRLELAYAIPAAPGDPQ